MIIRQDKQSIRREGQKCAMRNLEEEEKKKTKINKTENTLDWYSPSDEKMALMGLEEVATTH